MDAIVFDWDGTLVDTLDGLYRANVAVMEAFGLPFDEALYRRHYAPDWRLMYERLGIPGDRLAEANELWHRAFDAGATSGPFEGAREALGRLRDAGIALAVVTAGHRAIVEPQLHRFGFDELLPVRVFGDDLPVHKPDPAPLRRALDELRAPVPRPRDGAGVHTPIAYVGDAPDDMRMARAVGVRAIGVASLLGDPDELRAAGADEVADSVAAWVAELLGDASEPVA